MTGDASVSPRSSGGGDRAAAPTGDGLLRGLLRRRRLVLGLAALLVVAALPGLLRLETDNSPEVFLLADSPAVARYQALRQSFGSDRTARIGLLGRAVDSPAGLAWVGAVAERITALPGVETVLAPRAPTLPVGDDSPAHSFDSGASALADPLDRAAGLRGEPGEGVASLLVTLPGAGTSRQHADTLAAIRGVLAAPPAGIEVLYAGLPPLDEALDRSSAEVLEVFFPLLVGLAAGLLLLVFWPAPAAPGGSAVATLLAPHMLAGLLVPLGFVGFVEILLLGGLGWLGIRLNLVLAILPPLVFVVALATAIHVVTRFRDRELDAGTPPEQAVIATFADKGPAILWTAVTTIAGFGSLATSPVGPVRSLGLTAAAALVLMTVAAYTVLPALLASLPHPPAGGHGRAERLAAATGRRLAAWGSRRRRLVLGAALLAALAGAAGLPRLSIESNALTYLDPDTALRRDTARLEALGIGTATVDVVLDAAPGTFREGQALGRLAWLAELLREEPGVLGVVGLGDLVDATYQRRAGAAAGLVLGLDALRASVLAELLADPAGRRAAGGFLTPDGATTRLVVFTRTVGFDELDPLRQRLLEIAGPELPEATVSTSGLFPLLLETQRRLLSTLGGSFGLTLLMVLLTFTVLLARARWVAAAAVPNLLPVLVTFGAMGWFGVPLDLATVMVASTTLGLAVDDTIHSLVHLRPLRRADPSPQAVAAQVERAVADNAAAYAITGLVLATGFGVCALSSFAPIARFGALSTAAIAMAIVADFLLIPALFGTDRRPGAEKG